MNKNNLNKLFFLIASISSFIISLILYIKSFELYQDEWGTDITEKEFKEEMKAYVESLNFEVDDPSWIEIIISYFKNFDKCEVNDISKIDIKLKKPKNFKDRWDNFCTLWLNYDFYMKYKDSAGLKTIRRQIKNNR